MFTKSKRFLKVQIITPEKEKKKNSIILCRPFQIGTDFSLCKQKKISMLNDVRLKLWFSKRSPKSSTNSKSINFQAFNTVVEPARCML